MRRLRYYAPIVAKGAVEAKLPVEKYAVHVIEYSSSARAHLVKKEIHSLGISIEVQCTDKTQLPWYN